MIVGAFCTAFSQCIDFIHVLFPPWNIKIQISCRDVLFISLWRGMCGDPPHFLQ